MSSLPKAVTLKCSTEAQLYDLKTRSSPSRLELLATILPSQLLHHQTTQFPRCETDKFCISLATKPFSILKLYWIMHIKQNLLVYFYDKTRLTWHCISLSNMFIHRGENAQKFCDQEMANFKICDFHNNEITRFCRNNIKTLKLQNKTSCYSIK